MSVWACMRCNAVVGPEVDVCPKCGGPTARVETPLPNVPADENGVPYQVRLLRAIGETIVRQCTCHGGRVGVGFLPGGAALLADCHRCTPLRKLLAEAAT